MNSQAVHLVLPATIAMISLAMGLGLSCADFRRLAAAPRATLVGLVGQLLLLPLLGFVVALPWSGQAEIAIGFVLLTACPGGAHSNLFANLARGDTALSVTLTAISGLAATVTIPLYVSLAGQWFAGASSPLTLSFAESFRQVLLILALPLAAGVAIHERFPSAAPTLERWIKGIAISMLLLIVIGSVARQGGTVLTHLSAVGGTVLVLNLSALTLGALLARIARLGTPQALAISLEVGIQNTALAVGLALGSMQNLGAATPAIVYSLLVYGTGALVVFIGRRLVPKG